MSAVSETRQPSEVGRRREWRGARLLRWLLGLVLLGVILLVLAGIGLAWRLAQGPLDVTWLVRAVESVQAGGAVPGVTVGQASIAWNGFNDGTRSGLELRLHDLHASSDTGTSASVARADITLDGISLLSAKVVPREIVLDGVRLRAVRDRQGSLRLDVDGGTPSGNEGTDAVLAELRRPAGSAEMSPSLAGLERLAVEHAQVTVRDETSGTSVVGDIADLDLKRRAAGGINGSAQGRLVVDGTALSLRLSAELMPDGGTHWEASLLPLSTRPLDTAMLTRLDPALAPLGLLDTTVQATASLDMTPALLPERAVLTVSTGAGTLTAPGSAPVAFDRAALHATAAWTDGTWRPSSLHADPAEAVVIGRSGRKSTIRVTGDAARAGGHWAVRGTGGFDQADFADLPSLWPVTWGGHTRPWLTDNVTAGLAHDAAFTAQIDIPVADPAHLQVTQAGGTMQADDVVIHWLRPVPPITHARATLTVTGPDDMVIAIPRAQQGPIALTDGLLRFTGLSHKDQYLTVTAGVLGNVPDLLAVLREPRLQLLDAHPLPITASAGKIAGALTVNVPMFDHLTFDQISIAAKGKLTGLRLNGIVAGRDIEQGTVAFDVTQAGLKASGPMTLAGVVGAGDVAMNFQPGPPTDITQQAHFVGRIGAPELAAQGIETAGVLTRGAALVDTTYLEQRDGQARVLVSADLAQAGLAVAGWHKAPGPAARVAATVLLRHGTIMGVPQLSASGPGLEVVARAEMVDGAPRVLRLSKIVLGPTRLSGEIVFPADPDGAYRVSATGPVLDLADQIKQLGRGTGGTGERSWIVDTRIGRVILGDGRHLTDLALHAEHIGGRLQSLQASTAGAEQLRASITPVANGRRLLVHAADLGAMLRGLDLTGSIGGGRLAVDATYDDRVSDPPLEGRVQLSQFGVRDGVLLGKLLQAVTIYGIVDAMRREGVYFSEAQVPFCLCQNILQLGPSRMSSASLGLTAQGWIDLNSKTLALNGTVVPAYVLNTALGRLPLIGKLFTTERGGGLIAADFTVAGPTASPTVSVNPLSLLTPGILRRLFE